jgi:hypothetical protein
MAYEVRCIDCGRPFQRTQRARSHRCPECRQAAPLKRLAALSARRKAEAAEARSKLVCAYEFCGRPNARPVAIAPISAAIWRIAGRIPWMPPSLRGDAG